MDIDLRYAEPVRGTGEVVEELGKLGLNLVAFGATFLAGLGRGKVQVGMIVAADLGTFTKPLVSPDVWVGNSYY